MHVQMKDDLARPALDVNLEPVPGTVYVQFPGKGAAKHDHGCHKRSVLARELVNAPDMLLGHDEHVDRGMGVDVPEGKKSIVLMKDISGFFPCDDPAKKTVPFTVIFHVVLNYMGLASPPPLA
jgi:hypothetical protein